MKEIKICKMKLSDFATVIMGQSPSSNFYNEEGKGLPFFQGVTDFSYKYPNETFWTTVAPKKAEINDVLFSVRAPVGDVNIANKKCCIGRGIAAIRSKTNQIDYLYYLLKYQSIKIQRLGTGAVYDAIKKSDLENILLDVFEDPNSQFQVGSLLVLYDDLIGTNRRRIQLLEEAARLLFREWFVYFRFPGYEKVKIVDGVPEGWVKGLLEDSAIVKKGKNITFEHAVEGDIPVVGGGLGPTYYHNKANVSAPVITISASGANAGYVNMYDTDIWASDCSYIDKNSTKYVYSLYLKLKSLQTTIFGFQVGVAQPHVYPRDLNRLKLLIAPDDLCMQFEQLVTPIFNLIKNLKLENQKLAQARDLLLPRLMSGEIEVSESNIEISKEAEI